MVAPEDMHKLGKGGSLASRQAILHSLVHIESWAVDLSWDVVARFGSNTSYTLPNDFISDFIQVHHALFARLLSLSIFYVNLHLTMRLAAYLEASAQRSMVDSFLSMKQLRRLWHSKSFGLQVAVDEASHFQCLQERLEAVGSWYGALPVHDGLWESAEATAHSLPARLAVESCVHEARGLDRLPLTIQKFQKAKDTESVKLLERIYKVSIKHTLNATRIFVNRVYLQLGYGLS